MTDLNDLRQGWEKLKERGQTAPLHQSQAAYSYYRPFTEAADEYIHWAQTETDRVYTGISELDKEMRGIAKGEMTLILGYSHSGKTLVLMQMLKANRDKRVIYFCPDEPRTLTLVKLACLQHGYKGRELERQVAEGDQRAINLLRRTAAEDFPNLAVFDQSLALSDMEKAYHETCDVWGDAPHLVVFDYLELLHGGGEDVPSKANTIKAWGKRHDVPLLVLHQTSRTAGADGKKMTISSGSFGGEQQATHIIGVRRKLFEIQGQIRELEEKLDKTSASERQMERLDLLRYDERLHKWTLTINLVKNKRMDSDRVDDIDFEIEQGTGRLLPLKNGDLPHQYRMEP
jgi:KaiC/GvpD/RAD55 family RecA-like ATPase